MPTDAMDVNAGALTNVVDEKIEPVSEKGVVPHFGSNGSDDGHDIYPTVEELNLSTGLRRISAPIPWAVYTIAFVELCERFSYYGTQVVFSNYVNKPLPTNPSANFATGAAGSDPEGHSGAYGMGTAAANGINTFNSFWIYTTPLFGAYLADAHWGRYKTICVALAVAIFGHILIVISSIPGIINHTNGSLACFIIGIVVMGLGTGGFKPNISPLVVEQIHFGQYTISTLPSGERVIIDPVITQSRVYHYYYLFVNIGALVGQIGMSYAEKYVGFWLAFTLPTAIFLICPAIMAWGKKRYTQAKPQGSVLSKAMRILMFAQKGRWSINPVRTWKNMHDGTFWESVKPSNIAPANRPSWMTFDDQWVDEVARGFAACAVFAWYPLYWITYNQLNNNLTAQADTMILNGIPNDVLSNLDPFALIILIPICDSFIYPALRKYGIRFTPIRKIAAGFFTGTAGMIWAAVLQYYIYQRSPCGNQANTCTDDDGNSLVADINVWAQTGAYVLIAVSEIFASITSLEYAFSKAPKNMRSLVQAVALFTSAISSAIGEALNPLSEDPLLVWNYGTMAVLSFVGGILFYIQFRGLDAEEEELNMLPEGHVVAVKTLDDEVDMPRPIADEIKI